MTTGAGLAGDGRFDSPGWSAKFLTYFLQVCCFFCFEWNGKFLLAPMGVPTPIDIYLMAIFISVSAIEKSDWPNGCL